MKEKLISVIVPIYKVEKYLKKCVDSIINQTYKNLEIILVDDGSPDRCPQICDEYAKKDSRIKVIHKKNGGLSDARNNGIKAVTGEYFCFMDSDDYLCPNYVQHLYEISEKNNADLSICDCYWVYDENQKLPKQDLTFAVYEKQPVHLLVDIGVRSVIANTKLYRTSLYFDLEFPVGKIHEDEFVAHEVLHKAKCVVVTNAKLYYYIQRTDSIMGRQKVADYIIQDSYDAQIARLEFLRKNKYEKILLNNTINAIAYRFACDLTTAKGLNDRQKKEQLHQQIKSLKDLGVTMFKVRYIQFKMTKLYNYMKKPIKLLLGKKR